MQWNKFMIVPFRSMVQTIWRKAGQDRKRLGAPVCCASMRTKEGPSNGSAPILERLHEAQPRHLSGVDDVRNERGREGSVPRAEPPHRQPNPEPLCRRRDG